MKKNILSLALCLLVLCGCKNASTNMMMEGGERIMVDITQPEKNIKMSDLCANVRYVKLETTSESLIKYIRGII